VVVATKPEGPSTPILCTDLDLKRVRLVWRHRDMATVADRCFGAYGGSRGSTGRWPPLKGFAVHERRSKTNGVRPVVRAAE